MPFSRRVLRRLAGVAVATLMTMVALLPFSPSAAAAGLGDCVSQPSYASWVAGPINNHTDFYMARIYEEKGVTKTMGSGAAQFIAPDRC